MKIIEKLLMIVVSIILITAGGFNKAKAQSESTNQVGLRLGGFSGVSFTHISGNNVGVEGDLMVHYWGGWTMLSLLAEKHIPTGKGFVFFLGGGGFFAYDYDYYYHHHEGHFIVYRNPTWGIETVLGVDYYIPNAPLNIGFDVRPRFSFLARPYPWDAGLSFRYIF